MPPQGTPLKVDHVTVVVPSPAWPPPSKTHDKKKKSKHASDRSSTFNFLNKKIMMVDQVNLALNEYERNQFASPSRVVLRNALIEAQVCACC